MAVGGKNRKIFSPRFAYLGPVPEYGSDLGLEGARTRKSLKRGREKIGKVCDWSLGLWCKRVGEASFLCQMRLLSRGKWPRLSSRGLVERAGIGH